MALIWLKEGELPVTEAASRLGSQSDAAFNRAFKRAIGVTQGAVRKSNSVSAYDQ